MKISKLHTKISNDQIYNELVYEILNHPKVQEMHEYLHHADNTVFTHSLHVSYVSYRISKMFHLDYLASARGGLLHDFFLYDWHEGKPEKGFHAHLHPKIALRNANEYFLLSDLEIDIIAKHMWPVTIKPPKHAESMLISFVDKYCAVSEAYQSYTKRVKQKVKASFS
ncbi:MULTISPECIES: HD domain-containing protein [unclassified Breznakia]|uniref:HD domain-containing protein n=1 Tax=unclassified Breznakia TaxID=2623764 RepID=UPI002405C0B7|nr:MULTISPECIES: HD domain-containing protein [unclassified Breznakia]